MQRRLGAYEIVAPLGAGGMGEVYRARDTRLGREVAVKVLPADVASDPERLRRFEQEAKAASATHHPNLLTVFDVGTHDGVAYLVTELLSGESLRELVRRGPVSTRRAVEIATQLARGLAAAHDKGIVHRDLKPENLFLTREGVAKVLDFGLARIERRELAGTDLQNASTAFETAAGTMFGTLGYMAPEQVRGGRADARSDIFSLGVVLHELLAGANPFRRDSAVETLSAILKEEPPDLTAAPVCADPALARLVARLLEKDPERRFRNSHDLAFALESVAGAPSGGHAAPTVGRTGTRSPSVLRFGALALLLAVGATAYWLGRREATPAPQTAVRFEFSPPADTVFMADSFENVTLALSPDGQRIAFLALEGTGSRVTGSRVWLRKLDELEARPLAGTDGASSLTWSPDGRSIAYFAGGKLQRVDPDSGAPVPICDVPPGIGHAASWGASGEILFASVQGDVVFRVPANGGTPQKVAQADASRQEFRINWPLYLPDGSGFLYLSRSRDKKVALMLVDGEGPPREVAALASRVEFLAPDWLLFARDGALYAQRFDRSAARLTGAAVSIAPFARYFFSSAWAGFAASTSGSIAYLTGRSSSRLLWFNRAGEEHGSVGAPADYANVMLSPDGRSVLTDRTVPELGTHDLWRIDLDRGTETRLTTDPDADFNGVWFPGGRSIVYSTIESRAPNLVRHDLDTGKEELLWPRETFQSATDVSRDGRLLAFIERGETGKFHAMLLHLEGQRSAEDLFSADAGESSVRFSPDGRFVAYISDLSGRSEAYIARVAGPSASIRISLSGAFRLRWSREGSEIFLLSADNELVSVPVRTSPNLEVGQPRTLFRLRAGKIWADFDATSDGQRFLALVRERSAGSSPATVFVGWRPPADG